MVYARELRGSQPSFLVEKKEKSGYNKANKVILQ